MALPTLFSSCVSYHKVLPMCPVDSEDANIESVFACKAWKGQEQHLSKLITRLIYQSIMELEERLKIPTLWFLV